MEVAAALIRHRTPNPPGEERALAEYLAADLARRGLEVQLLPVDPAPDDPQGARTPRANVLARLPGAPGAPGGESDRGQTLVLCGHLDTVPPGEGTWTREPYTPRVEGGRLYGLGATDMKGAIGAMVMAATRLLAAARAGRPLRGDLLLAFTSGEETGSRGARALARSGLLDGAGGMVIGEPTGNRVGVAEKGGAWMELVFEGRTAHGSLPGLGANAVAGLAETLAWLERLCEPPGSLGDGGLEGGLDDADRRAAEALERAFRRPEHALLGRPTLVPTRVAGGVANNVVPDRASAVLDIRTLPGQSNEALYAAVEEVAAAVAARRGLSIHTVDHGQRPALETAEDHPLARACAAAVQQVTGRPAPFCGLTGATDATELVPPLGLPFVICGPGEMAQAHQPDEFVSVGALEQAVEVYVALANMICGT